LEAGFAGAPQLGPVFRLLADLCLAAVFTLFSLAVPMDSNPDNKRPYLKRGEYKPGSKSFNSGRGAGSRF
ncbi:MAG: hypothetical protein ABFD25_03175, partial [Clostridiaceae bacterium]